MPEGIQESPEPTPTLVHGLKELLKEIPNGERNLPQTTMIVLRYLSLDKKTDPTMARDIIRSDWNWRKTETLPKEKPVRVQDDVNGLITKVFMANRPEFLRETIEDLETTGFAVETFENGNWWIRNQMKVGEKVGEGGNGKILYDCAISITDKKRARQGSTDINREFLNFPMNWGEVLVLDNGRAIVGSNQIQDLLGIAKNTQEEQSNILKTTQFLKDKFSWSEVIVVGSFKKEKSVRPDTLYDFDLVITPFKDGVVLADIMVEEANEYTPKMLKEIKLIQAEMAKVKKQLEESGVPIYGTVPSWLYRDTSSFYPGLKILSYSNCLVDQDNVLVPRYILKNQEEVDEQITSHNQEAIEAWQKILKPHGVQPKPIRFQFHASNGDKYGASLRCASVEQRSPH
jgi:hypothetical protein